MTREQHEFMAAWLGPWVGSGATDDDEEVALAQAAAHHARAALQCERCGGSGSTPLPGSRYAGANIRCPACGGVGWGAE